MDGHLKRRVRLAQSVCAALTGDDNLPRELARLFSRGLTADWQAQSLNWRASWSTEALDAALRLVRSARTLERAGENASAAAAWRRAGEILEWLTRAGDELRSEVPIALLAGAAFQLGRLPAMAWGLLARPEVREWESPIHAAFLRGEFADVLDGCAAFWATSEDSPESEERTQVDGDSLVSHAMKGLVRCLGLVAACIRHGDSTRIDAALTKLDAIAAWSVRTAQYETALLVGLEASAARQFWKSSVHMQLQPLADGAPAALGEALNRFKLAMVASGRPLVWPAQSRGIERLASGSSFALCTPTGSGKTMVAMLAATVGLFGSNSAAPVVLYLVPSRALAMEIEREGSRWLRLTGTRVSSLYGGTDWGGGDVDLQDTHPLLLVCTVEKAEALIRYAGLNFVSRIQLLVLDEAHLVVMKSDDARTLRGLASAEDRSLRLESFVARLRAMRQALPVIALSAVAMASEEDLAAWVGAPATDQVGEVTRSTRQVVGWMDIRRGGGFQIEIERYNGVLMGEGQARFLPLRLPELPEQTLATLTDGPFANAETSALWAALQLAARGRTILISIGARIEATQSRFSKALRSRAWRRELPTHFAVEAGSPGALLHQRALAATAEFCGEASHEYQLLTRGVASHHGQLPHAVRRLVTQLIRERVIRVVVATSTLSEGVNLPVDMVILPLGGRRFFDSESERWRHIAYSPSEFLNLSGRAGRPGLGLSMEGITVFALPRRLARGRRSPQERELWATHDEVMAGLDGGADDPVVEQSPIAQLLSLITRLATSIGVDMGGVDEWLGSIEVEHIEADSSQLAEAVDSLDLVLLQAVAEAEMLSTATLSRADLELALRNLWAHTYAAVAATEEERMQAMVLSRGVALHDALYTDADERRSLYMLGMPPHKGRAFRETGETLEAILREGEGYGGWEDEVRGAFLARIVGCLREDRAVGFGEAATPFLHKLHGSWINVLSWWLGLSDQGPSAAKFRAWARFAQSQFDHKTGAALGGVLARIWDAAGMAEPPTVGAWKELAQLPWVAYWARDLLRWGTPDPVCAYLLSRQRVVTRAAGAQARDQYVEWLLARNSQDSEDRLSPILIREWENEQYPSGATDDSLRSGRIGVTIDPAVADRAESLVTWPSFEEGGVTWFDPAGYRLAASEVSADLSGVNRKRAQFTVDLGRGEVRWTQA